MCSGMPWNEVQKNELYQPYLPFQKKIACLKSNIQSFFVNRIKTVLGAMKLPKTSFVQWLVLNQNCQGGCIVLRWRRLSTMLYHVVDGRVGWQSWGFTMCEKLARLLRLVSRERAST